MRIERRKQTKNKLQQKRKKKNAQLIAAFFCPRWKKPFEIFIFFKFMVTRVRRHIYFLELPNEIWPLERERAREIEKKNRENDCFEISNYLSFTARDIKLHNRDIKDNSFIITHIEWHFDYCAKPISHSKTKEQTLFYLSNRFFLSHRLLYKCTVTEANDSYHKEWKFRILIKHYVNGIVISKWQCVSSAQLFF